MATEIAECFSQITVILTPATHSDNTLLPCDVASESQELETAGITASLRIVPEEGILILHGGIARSLLLLCGLHPCFRLAHQAKGLRVEIEVFLELRICVQSLAKAIQGSSYLMQSDSRQHFLTTAFLPSEHVSVAGNCTSEPRRF